MSANCIPSELVVCRAVTRPLFFHTGVARARLSEDGYEDHSHFTVYVPISPPPNRADGARDSDLAPLTEEECVILDAISNRAARYAVYSTPGKLEWGVGLKVGDTVLAQLPNSNGGKEEYTTAIIRWIGVPDVGHHSGVEIKVGVVCHGWWVVEGMYPHHQVLDLCSIG